MELLTDVLLCPILFSANHFQVTALLAFGQYLYASTTWGCIIVAEAFTIKPLSVFRCHGNEEFYCKAILPIGPACDPDRDGERKQNKSKSADGATSAGELDSRGSAGIVTIGRGYVDVVKRVTCSDNHVISAANASSPPAEHTTDKSAKCNTFVLSWDTQHWNYY